VTFSLFAGGPLYGAALRLGIVRGESTLVRLGIALAVLTWVPLAVLMAVTGITAASVAVPFVRSFGTHARLLVAIPLFFAAEVWAGPRLGSVLRHLVDSQLVLPEEMPSLDAAIASAIRVRDSAIAEVLLVVLTIVLMTLGVRTDLPGDASTWRSMGGVLTPAGWWYAAVSLPVFQFLCWRWCWRLAIWTLLLWRVSRLNLALAPTHPDLSGGLGYLAVAHTHFGTLGLAVSVVLSASFAEQIRFAGAPPQSFLPLIGAIVAVNLLVFLGPLAFFTARMIDVKRRGLREYGVVAATYTHLFEAKWVGRRAAPGEPLLGTADIQSLADLANSFAVVRNMRLVPFGPVIIANLTLAAVAPMVPLLLFQFSLEELVLKLARLLLG
jgi:hypothetical protein